MTRKEKYRRTKSKNRAYKTRHALRLIRKHQPKTLEEAQALGMGALVEVGQGAFRTAYHIYGTNLLIKFPLQCRYRIEEVSNGPEVWHSKEGKNHTRMEVKKIRALSEFPVMRKHLPPLYYYNGRDGVLVTKYYPKTKWIQQSFHRLITEMIKEYCGVVIGDLAQDNVRTHAGDNLIFIDCGY